MSASFLPAAVLLSALQALAADRISPPLNRTFTSTDPTTGRLVVCDYCPPGTYLHSSCTETQKGVCAPCPPGTFTEVWNYISKCLRCRMCAHNQVVTEECHAQGDCQCGCQQGFYFHSSDMCVRHRRCPAGQGVHTKGTADEDTVCQVCPSRTFSDIISADQNCTEHRSCSAAGLQLLLKGSIWHDSICMSCQDPRSREGAEYLREILPAFFSSQKIPARQLRYITKRLASASGKLVKTRALGLNVWECKAWIKDWVSTATAERIRQLPMTLRQSRARGASVKLQNKLRHIDTHLSKLCCGQVGGCPQVTG
ncbi:tumor necrosis factor receptor superfamily member 6B-like [Aulostomus maculatus]